jgi:hypothetical protein
MCFLDIIEDELRYGATTSTLLQTLNGYSAQKWTYIILTAAMHKKLESGIVTRIQDKWYIAFFADPVESLIARWAARHKTDDPACSVCLEILTFVGPNVYLCNHEFHAGPCSAYPTCPLCRSARCHPEDAPPKPFSDCITFTGSHHKCVFCSYKTLTISAAVSHCQKSHSGETEAWLTKSLPCHGCPKMFIGLLPFCAHASHHGEDLLAARVYAL